MINDIGKDIMRKRKKDGKERELKKEWKKER